jgi:glycosyltransferase involved in cell wall biosynthesis
LPISITIVTPSYNQARYLEETIRSVLCQRGELKEYFVLDGGSRDGSVDIIRKYAPGIDFWVSQKDRGQSDAIHQGFSRATGDFLFWLNSDDVLLPGALARLRSALERNPNWDVATGYHARIDEQTRIVSLHRTPGETNSQVRGGVLRVAQQTCIFRRSLYERVGGLPLDLHCAMDLELWYRFFHAGAIWGHVPAYLAGYRWHSESKLVSGTLRRQQQQEIDGIAGRYPEYFPGGWRARAALVSYRFRHLLSGRYPLAAWDSRRFCGKKLTDVFGDWHVPDRLMAPMPAAHPSS